MVKTFRKMGKKVNFDSAVKNLALGEEGQEIKERFSEMKEAEANLERIQKSSKKGIFEKGKQIKQKQIELKKLLICGII